LLNFSIHPNEEAADMPGPVRTHVTYRPKKGREEELFALVRKHGPALQSTGLIVGGAPQVYRARNIRTGDVAFIEIFSWRDEKASGLAHQAPEVMAVWEPMTPLLDQLEINAIEAVSGQE
jgi:hypothetical protein